MANLNDSKVCSRCKTAKPYAEFHRDKTRADGYCYCCKTCETGRRDKDARDAYNRRYYDTHHDEILAQAAVYREQNREKHNASSRRWYWATVESRRKHSVAYYWRTREAQLTKARKYRLANSATINAKIRQWAKANPDKIRAHSHRRRARVLNAQGSHTGADIELQFRTQKGCCWHCGVQLHDNEWHVDHLVPLSRGGSNAPENIVIACPACNLSKGAKLPQEWNGRLF